MSAKKPPVTRTKEEHGSKEKLVDRLIGVLGHIAKSDESKEDLKGRLLAASNKKLLRLDEVAHAIKEKFGSVEKLAAETAQALGRAKDSPYVEKLRTMTPAKLLDLFRSSEKRAAKKSKAKKSKAA